MSKEFIKDNSQNDTRSDKLKLYSIGSVVLLALIILLVNFLFDKIFGKALTFDFSDTAQNSISQESIDYLNSLPEGTTIRVIGLFNRPDNVSNTKYQYIVPLLDDYVKESDGKVKVEYIDPNEHPSIIQELDPTNSFDLASNSENFVVSYNGKIRIIAPIDCYSYDQSYYFQTGNYMITGNNAEYTFTNTMYSLTQGFSGKAYIVTGLKEEGNTYIKLVLDGMSIETAELQSSDAFAIPDDCDLLILNGPNTDITEKMYVAMTDYISRGGKMLIAVDYSQSNVTEKYDRLNQLLNQMNVNADPLFIYENDPGYQRNGYASDSNVTVANAFASYSADYALHCSNGRSISQLNSDNSAITVIPALMTSNTAYALTLDQTGNPVDDGVYNSGTHYVAMYSGNESSGAEMFVFGTLNFTSDAYISAYGTNDSNVEFTRSCVRDLLNSTGNPTLGIATKTVDNFNIDTAKATTTSSTLVLIIFMMVIPILMIGVAVVVYTKRKNL